MLLFWLSSSSSHHTRGQQPIGNVKARLASANASAKDLGVLQADLAHLCPAGLIAGLASMWRHSGALVLGGREATVGYTVSYLVTE